MAVGLISILSGCARDPNPEILQNLQMVAEKISKAASLGDVEPIDQGDRIGQINGVCGASCPTVEFSGISTEKPRDVIDRVARDLVVDGFDLNESPVGMVPLPGEEPMVVILANKDQVEVTFAVYVVGATVRYAVRVAYG